ncbi:restriction modification system DNA specificity domain-containing protein [Caldithrix abyssi DSM 13497]|uniref:Restriction modification system DNA specificity domain-containing protein n=1 Tax=Caldithrix abyssi DSM 13497 TaxID=880073 RepID=H1XUN0_CALAY|nr:restriction endonuclease subunit S [Caldithrix abyssi]EHO40529.1 restriction modification system DNA specificity domain-containing protein [Caldithrix abyssi DSM 13497]
MNDYHWEKRKIGEIAQVIMGQSPDSKYYSNDEIGLPFLQGCAEFNNRFPKAKLYCSQPKKVGEKGSILFSVRAPVGKINIADRDYIIGRGLAAIKGIKIIQDFLEQYFLFSEEKFRKLSQGSTFESINSEDLSESEIFYPVNKKEQSLIAEILSTVDRAIEQTGAVIAKLQRIKAGLMQDLLTRGIDEQGNIRSEKTHRFKDSPLGRIPVEWEVVELQNVVKILLSNVDKKIYEHENSVLLCNYLEVYQNDYIHSRLNFSRGSVNENELRKFTVEKGDVIITKDSETFEDIAKPAYVKDNIDNLICGYHLALLKPKKINGLFLAIILNKPEINMHFRKLANGITRYGLTLETIKTAKIFLPKISEQKQISNIFLNIDLRMDEEKAKLRKLHMLKTALMQDLLTGRVRVTGLLKRRQAEVVG